jgi:hypothetical protein
MTLATGPGIAAASPDGLLSLAWVDVALAALLLSAALYLAATGRGRKDELERRLAILMLLLILPALVLAQRAFTSYQQLRSAAPPGIPSDVDERFTSWAAQISGANTVFGLLTVLIAVVALALLAVAVLARATSSPPGVA